MLNYALYITNYNKTQSVVLNSTKGGGIGIWECLIEPVRRFPYSIATELFNTSCTVEGLTVKFMVTDTLCSASVAIRQLVEFKYFAGCIVKLEVWSVSPSTGENVTYQTGAYVGITESMSIQAIDKQSGVYECELTIGNFDSLTNFVMDYSNIMPRAYGVGFFYTPAYAGLITARHSYYIGEQGIAGGISGSNANLVGVYDGGLSVLANVFAKTNTTITMTVQPTRELRVVTNQVGIVLSMSTPESNNIAWFPLEYFKFAGALTLYTFTSGWGTIEAFGVNDNSWGITSLGSIYKNIPASVGINLIGAGNFSNTTISSYKVIGVRVTMTNPVVCYTKLANVQCTYVAPLLLWLNGVIVDTPGVYTSVSHTRYAIDSYSICDIYMKFTRLEVSYQVDKGAKVNFREVLDAVANTVYSFVVCTSYAVLIKSINYGSPFWSLPVIPFPVVAGKTQCVFDRPPMAGNWKIGFNKKGGGGYSDLAGTVTAVIASWMRESQDFYVAGDSTASLGINPLMCSIMTADSLAVNKVTSKDPLPAFDIPNLNTFKNSSVYKVTLYTYDVINVFGVKVGSSYRVPSGILPIDVTLATLVITSNDVPFWWNSGFHPQTLVEVKGDLYI